MKIRIRKGMLVITLPLISPARKSKSGKTLLVASSNGPRRTSLKLEGKAVIAIVNVYVRPDGYLKGADMRRPKRLVRNRRPGDKRRQVRRTVPVKRPRR